MESDGPDGDNDLSAESDNLEWIADVAMFRCHRLSPMTDNHSDPEITTRILQEKEKDLELAARIGKALLQRNDELQKKNEVLEEQMVNASDQVTQLKHELQRKSELLRVFTDDENGDAMSDFRRSQERASCGHLRHRVRLLEEENVELKSEIKKLKALTQMLRDKEDEIVGEFLRKIAETKRQVKLVCTELQEKQDECNSKENKIRCLGKQISEKIEKEKQLKEENDVLTARLRIVQGIQGDLAEELADLQERYGEVVAMLVSAKDELKEARRWEPGSRYSTSSLPGDSLCGDSLASELEMSDSGYSTNCKGQYSSSTPPPRRDTTKNPLKSEPVEPTRAEYPTGLSQALLAVENEELEIEEKLATEDYNPVDDVAFDPIESDSEASEKAKVIMRSIEAALEMPNCTKIACQYSPRIGVPGTPGSKDLEFAIERLSQRVEPNASSTNPTSHDGQSNDDPAMRRKASRAKLMLVVPVEGSRSLAHWRQLATPSGIDPRSWQKLPGINIRQSFGPSNLRKTICGNTSGTRTPAVGPPPLMSSISTSQMFPTTTPTSNASSHSASSNQPESKGLRLTERCSALLNSVGASWFGGGSGPLEKSCSSSTVLPSKQETSKTGRTRRAVLASQLEEHGLSGSLCDLNLDQASVGNGVVMRTGLNM